MYRIINKTNTFVAIEYSENIKDLEIKQLESSGNYLMGLKHDIDALEGKLQELKDIVLNSQWIAEESKKVDTGKFETWDMKQIEKWLYSLENGRYRKYIDGLISAFKGDNIASTDLPDIDRADLRSFGVSDFKDRKDLLAHFVGLKQANEGLAASATAYI